MVSIDVVSVNFFSSLFFSKISIIVLYYVKSPICLLRVCGIVIHIFLARLRSSQEIWPQCQW